MPGRGGGAACGGCGARGGHGASPRACLAACALVLAYNLLGACLFLALEGGEESAVAAVAGGGAAALRARTVERLWALTEDLNILYKDNWTRLAARELLDFQRGLHTAPPAPRAAPADAFRWTFSTSFLYALTLITTIGHGDVAPSSAAGRAAAVAYASLGIPLVMLYLATLGAALARAARRLYARLVPPPPQCDRGKCDSELEKRTPFQAALNLDTLSPRACPARPRRVPAVLSVALLALYVGLGAALFARTERWSLVDGCYFSFSSLATIGFGSLRPGRRAASAAAAGEAGAAAALDAAVGACCAYILVGVALVAAAFDLLQEDLRAALRGLCGSRAGRGARGAVHSAERGVAPAS